MKKLLLKNNLAKAMAKPRFAINYGLGKLKAHLGYKLGLERSFMPGRVLFALTSRCNLNCEMCPQVNHPKFRDEFIKEEEITGAELREIVDHIATFKPIVFVSGGELFLHSAWQELLSYLKQKSLICSIGTNGMLLEKYAEELVEIGVDEISISLDGPEAIHDEIRRLPGTFARAVRGIKKIAALSEERGVSGPRFSVIFTITPRNHKLLPQMVEAISDLPIDVLRIGHLNHLRQQDFDAYMRQLKELFGLDRDISFEGYINELHDFDAVALADTIESLKQNGSGPMKFNFFPDFTRDEIIDYYSPQAFQSTSFNNACMIAWDMAVIGPKGEVIMCPNYEIGNVREQKLAVIWNNEKARSFRKMILKKKQFPVCSRGCCFFYI